MSKEVYHTIFYQSDGCVLAHEIKDFFARKRYNIQFNLQKLQGAEPRKAPFSGVSILLITPESYIFIQSRRDLDLNKLFPNPDYSVALLFHVQKSLDEISKTLASHIQNFDRWSLLEIRSGTGLSSLGIHIMQIVETIELNSLSSSSEKQFQVWQPHDIKPRQHVILIFDKPVDEGAEVMVLQEWDGTKQEAQHLNCMTYSFIIGETKPGDKNIEVLVNNVSYGKAMLHVHCVNPNMEQITTLLHSVINPVELICQCLHIVPENRQDLDRELVDMLSADKNSVGDMFDQTLGGLHSKSELPTLLHFGAKYGLTQFCMQLVQLPGSLHSLSMKNKDGLLPHDLAVSGGFDDLATVLQKTKKESDSDAFLPPRSQGMNSTKEKYSLTRSFRDSSHSESPPHGRQGNSLGRSLPSDIGQTMRRNNGAISPDYKANSRRISPDFTGNSRRISPDLTASGRRMTGVTGNMESSQYFGRQQPLPTFGKIKKKEHHYDLPSDPP